MKTFNELRKLLFGMDIKEIICDKNFNKNFNIKGKKFNNSGNKEKKSSYYDGYRLREYKIGENFEAFVFENDKGNKIELHGENSTGGKKEFTEYIQQEYSKNKELKILALEDIY